MSAFLLRRPKSAALKSALKKPDKNGSAPTTKPRSFTEDGEGGLRPRSPSIESENPSEPSFSNVSECPSDPSVRYASAGGSFGLAAGCASLAAVPVSLAASPVRAAAPQTPEPSDGGAVGGGKPPLVPTLAPSSSARRTPVITLKSSSLFDFKEKEDGYSFRRCDSWNSMDASGSSLRRNESIDRLLSDAFKNPGDGAVAGAASAAAPAEAPPPPLSVALLPAAAAAALEAFACGRADGAAVRIACRLAGALWLVALNAALASAASARRPAWLARAFTPSPLG